ncbi:pentapeptide repeat-containing protein [Streptomyces pseudogriseolus]|uniref:pentapeptide repeat-containing protein n=1 Tax=Streptomyces pseudogriseolus TaxID=36817 RepID=UPI003FA1CE5D
MGWVLVAAVAVGAVLLVWRGPWWLDADHLKGRGPMPGQAALATGFRTAVVQLLAVLGAGIALLFTASTYRLTRRGQVTDRFVKALERLGSDQMYVRIGGVIALEQIVQDAPDQATHATQVLNAFIRERAPRHAPKLPPPSIPPRLPPEPAADVQQALTALTRPQNRHHVDPDQHPDLTALHLTGAQLGGADLTGIQLDGADLTGIQLDGADLTHAWLSGADLTAVRLSGADLTDAWLSGADLTDAQLGGANLTDAQLGGANLTGARLHDADLTHAYLSRADLTDAQLHDANLTRARFIRAHLTDAWLSGADLTDAQLSGANLTGARLHDANLTRARLAGTDLTDAWLKGANLTDAQLKGANLTDAWLSGADLLRAKGLTVEQVVSAHPSPSTRLPPEIAKAPQVIARIREVDAGEH